MSLNKQDIAIELKKIWREVFGDPEEYIDLFFNKVYQSERAYFILQKDKIVSALHYIPLSLKIQNKEYKTAYICGVSTYPQYEGQGYMSQLMNTCLSHLQNLEYDFACLIPANEGLFNLYRKFDFYPLFFSNQFNFTSPQKVYKGCKQLSLFAPKELTDVYNLFKFQESKNDYIILHTKEMIALAIEEFMVTNGEVIVLKNGEFLEGIAFCQQEEGLWNVKELLSKDKATDEILLELLLKRYNQKNIYANSSNYFYNNDIPKGMIRILNPKIIEDFKEEKGKDSFYNDTFSKINNHQIMNPLEMAKYIFKNKKGKINLVLE